MHCPFFYQDSITPQEGSALLGSKVLKIEVGNIKALKKAVKKMLAKKGGDI